MLVTQPGVIVIASAARTLQSYVRTMTAAGGRRLRERCTQLLVRSSLVAAQLYRRPAATTTSRADGQSVDWSMRK